MSPNYLISLVPGERFELPTNGLQNPLLYRLAFRFETAAISSSIAATPIAGCDRMCTEIGSCSAALDYMLVVLASTPHPCHAGRHQVISPNHGRPRNEGMISSMYVDG
jgi:hypothetical protein